MNRKFATIFASVCIAAALGAIASVAYRVLAQGAEGRESAKADFEGLCSVLSSVKGPSDLGEPSLRARLAARYEASPALLLVDVREKGAGDRWRIPADSPYLASVDGPGGRSEPSYPPASTILLSAPLKGDSSGKLAVDALYVSLPQAYAFAACRDALIGLGAFLALAALVLALVSGAEGARGQGPREAFAADSAADEKGADNGFDEIDMPSVAASDLAAAGAQYQFETLDREEDAAESEDAAPDEEFDIPIMEAGLAIKSAPEDTPASAAAYDESGPAGLFSPSSGLGWESYMIERLDAEISRSASFEQDLSILAFSYDGLTSHDDAYASIGKEIRDFFSFRDLAFERGDDGFSVILPNIDSNHALRMAEEFNKKLVFLAEGDFAELELLPIYMGISSRAGRLVDAGRLVEEAATALDKARYEKDSHIVAFRPDPDKYRLFLASKGA